MLKSFEADFELAISIQFSLCAHPRALLKSKLIRSLSACAEAQTCYSCSSKGKQALLLLLILNLEEGQNVKSKQAV
jgi:hypothetical protein